MALLRKLASKIENWFDAICSNLRESMEKGEICSAVNEKEGPDFLQKKYRKAYFVVRLRDIFSRNVPNLLEMWLDFSCHETLQNIRLSKDVTDPLRN